MIMVVPGTSYHTTHPSHGPKTHTPMNHQYSDEGVGHVRERKSKLKIHRELHESTRNHPQETILHFYGRTSIIDYLKSIQEHSAIN